MTVASFVLGDSSFVAGHGDVSFNTRPGTVVRKGNGAEGAEVHANGLHTTLSKATSCTGGDLHFQRAFGV